MSNESFLPFIVADIGGTNARFGVVSGNKDAFGRYEVEQQLVFSSAAYASFELAFSAYLDALVLSVKPKYACIAIAGPIIGDSVRMTNLDWAFSVKALVDQFDMIDIKLINDFGALSYATLFLMPHELEELYTPNLVQDRHDLNRVVIGSGTGLGVAGLIKTSTAWQPVCGEGGHVSFAALDSLEVNLRDALLSLWKGEAHVSVENVLSGQGLVNLYRGLCRLEGVKELHFEPSEVSAHAAQKTNSQCEKALRLFSKILGATAGDVALTMGAFGGVYLSGGILPKVADSLDRQLLIESYLAKGIQRNLMESIPVYLVSAPMPALVGAAHWMCDELGHH